MHEAVPESMEPTHRLLYFDIAGKAESIRLAFVYSGSAFEDYRFKDRAEFLALQESPSQKQTL